MGKGSLQKDFEFPSVILSCFQCSTSAVTPILTDKLHVRDQDMRVDVVNNVPAVSVLQPVKRRIGAEKETRRGPCQDITNVTAALCSPPKRAKNAPMTVTSKEMAAFFKIFDDSLIQDFLWMDNCAKVADKYLIAMVFAYFKRANYTISQYTRMNFFVALYLANDMEEDEEEFKYEIFPWALGLTWRDKYPSFLRKRDKLLKTIEYRAAVSRKCCEELMAISPKHYIWLRDRQPHHAGAIRHYENYLGSDESNESFPRGPGLSPIHCELCAESGSFAYCSPGSHITNSPSCHLYLASCTDTSTDSPDGDELPCKPYSPSMFDMHGLKSTLQTEPNGEDSYFWASCHE
ncbi:speedy protein A-like [Patiria miniata]|uniref:Speedy protein A n=1 Tax=Patiria miniata TaxID=46514 RepID=A0A914BDQ7_PATMI|nr:speedy protein A-like [Patiria miniata]